MTCFLPSLTTLFFFFFFLSSTRPSFYLGTSVAKGASSALAEARAGLSVLFERNKNYAQNFSYSMYQDFNSKSDTFFRSLQATFDDLRGFFWHVPTVLKVLTENVLAVLTFLTY
jgi:hypothetical protein